MSAIRADTLVVALIAFGLAITAIRSAARARSSAQASPAVTASIRRVPAPTEPSERIKKGPISAVQRTWVPPQSSWL